ncbi:MAG TPA: methyltransferase [Candidatus Sulfopaludibacter sp.]|jgi:SAM-dependent methyltransferase|nr:methyltransferase [Candidatus Sulfopaludibacter sp.]
MADLWSLSDLCTPWCVHVAATLRVAENIQAGHSEIGALAEACGADRESLQRMLRHLASKGVFEEASPGRFTLNHAARGLIDGRIGFDLDGIGGRMAYAWSTLLPAVRTGRPAYHEVFGRPFWDDLEANPKIAASFDELMGIAGHGAPDPEVLVNPADWERVKSVVDVGGGTGVLLTEILRAHPGIEATLVELPRAAARAAEVPGLTVVAQSFFDPLPAGRDLYILKSVIGDWPDAEARRILQRCADAARPAGRVVVFTCADAGKQADPELLMMVLVGGKGRSLEEFRELAGSAGLEVTACGHQPTGRGIVECRPLAR